MNRQRNNTLDFAKGFALVFMVVQHLSVWLWGGYAKSATLLDTSPIYFIAISFSAISAPLFIFAAGCGAQLFLQKYQNNLKIFRRGLLLLTLGYALNVAIPSWFSVGSWYVLQMIGFGFVLVPLLRRMSFRCTIILLLVVVLATIALQVYLDTPLGIGNKRMSEMTLPGGFLRLALVEGHFPVFPWLIFFMYGFLSVTQIINEKYKKLLIIGAFLLFLAALCALIYFFFPSVKNSELLSRIFVPKARFYPMLLPALLFLTGILPFVLYFFSAFAKYSGPIAWYFTSIGRISLTVFITHALLKQFIYSTALVGTFSKWSTIALTIALLGFYSVLEYFWRKYYYRFGFEWLLRKVG